MKYLTFFDSIEKIVVYGELCKFLGVKDEVIGITS